MAGMTDAGKHAALGGLKAAATYFALYDGDPDSGGTELSGGSYARVATDWEAVPGTENPGSLNNTTAALLEVPGAVTALFVAVMTAVSGGNVLDSEATGESYGAGGGQYRIDDFDFNM